MKSGMPHEWDVPKSRPYLRKPQGWKMSKKDRQDPKTTVKELFE
jgi:hypothetical protein